MPTGVARTGVSHASASIAARPKPSASEGTRTASAALIQSGIWSGGVAPSVTRRGPGGGGRSRGRAGGFAPPGGAGGGGQLAGAVGALARPGGVGGEEQDWVVGVQAEPDARLGLRPGGEAI